MKGNLSRSLVALLALFMSVQLFAQQKVSGVVKNAFDEPLIGVFVFEDGTQNAVATDVDGRYSITVRPSANLHFSYVGYADVILPVQGPVLNVTMLEDVTTLDDVVVIGYGNTTRKEVTGSVASVKSDDFLQGSNSSPYDLINGKIAGLSIVRYDGGDPNGGISIQLRGNTTMSAGAEPLVVIDNVVGGSLDSINPEEIESIDVLKDGSAAAIYGTRGTNGVILITTKKGKPGVRASVDFSSYASLQTVNRKLEVLTAKEFREILAKGYTGFDGGSDTDWLDAITRKTQLTQY